MLTRTTTEQFFTDAQDQDDEIEDAWGEMGDEEEEEEDPFLDAPSPAPVTTTTTTTAFDDGGEPDFEGWLNAQARAKSKAPLPKGLAKPAKTTTASPGRVPVIRSTTTGAVGSGAGVKKIASTTTTVVKPSVAPPRGVVDTKPKEAVDDDWGDAWD